MTTAIYRYCSNPYSIPKLYSNARCEVLEFSGRRVKIRLLEFLSYSRHRPGDIMRVLRRNIHITGLASSYLSRPVNMQTVRLPYKD
jgi:hypothetical protein